MNKYTKAYLWYVGLFWTLYGLVVIFKPEILTMVANMGQESWVAAVEVRAMYGGLEYGLGLFTLLGLCPAFDYHRAALVLNAIVLSSLAVVRLAGLLIDGPGASGLAVSFGMDMAAIPASYNSGALWFFEVPGAIVGWLLLYKTKNSVVSVKDQGSSC